MLNRSTETNPRTLARIAGILYLVIFITAGFSQGFVRESMIVPGDASATAGNILAAEGLFRLGFASDLIAFMSDLVVSVLLYVLLKPAGKTLALIMVALRLIAHPAIASLNLLGHYNALLLLGGVGGGGYLDVFSPEQVNALVLFVLNSQRIGYMIAGSFFGLSLAFLGWLLLRSDRFPGWLGILLAVAAGGYLIESFGTFLAPQNQSIYSMIVTVTAVVGEFALTGWLLIKGIKAQPSEDPSA